MSNLSFSAGESSLVAQSFSPSLSMFWLKTEVAATNTRVVSRRPNALFGLIPLGYSDTAIPIANVASVGTEVKFHPWKAILGLLCLIAWLASLGSAVGWIWFLVGALFVVNAVSAALVITNNGGAITRLRVSALEKTKLEQLRDEINSRLFADVAGLRHAETVDLQRSALLAQQAQVDLLRQQGEATRPE